MVVLNQLRTIQVCSLNKTFKFYFYFLIFLQNNKLNRKFQFTFNRKFQFTINRKFQFTINKYFQFTSTKIICPHYNISQQVITYFLILVNRHFFFLSTFSKNLLTIRKILHNFYTQISTHKIHIDFYA